MEKPPAPFWRDGENDRTLQKWLAKREPFLLERKSPSVLPIRPSQGLDFPRLFFYISSKFDLLKRTCLKLCSNTNESV
jgi:hypothetical protein